MIFLPDELTDKYYFKALAGKGIGAVSTPDKLLRVFGIGAVNAVGHNGYIALEAVIPEGLCRGAVYCPYGIRLIVKLQNIPEPEAGKPLAAGIGQKIVVILRMKGGYKGYIQPFCQPVRASAHHKGGMGMNNVRAALQQLSAHSRRKLGTRQVQLLSGCHGLTAQYAVGEECIVILSAVGHIDGAVVPHFRKGARVVVHYIHHSVHMGVVCVHRLNHF